MIYSHLDDEALDIGVVLEGEMKLAAGDGCDVRLLAVPTGVMRASVLAVELGLNVAHRAVGLPLLDVTHWKDMREKEQGR